jgi:hypothetical protein
VIDTREELVNALTEAAELEHGLLLQYLFAAYSMKKRADEGLGPEEQELVRGWEGLVLAVARDEMAHLGNVCNLLSAIGGAPRLGRPNFPQPRGSWYPFDFRLVRFGDDALYRFCCFELPEDEPPPPPPARIAGRERALLALAAEEIDVVPDPSSFELVGELYGKIRDGFRALPHDELFIGPSFAQDTDDWSNRFRLHLVRDAESAVAAIDAIVLEGEGAPGTARTDSHYERFMRVRAALAERPGFDAARPVVSDPRTQEHRDAQAGGTMITEPAARRVAEIFNATYITTLLLLMQYYGYGGESPEQREAIRSSIRHLMSAALRPLAEVLTELPATDAPDAGTAGPPFELYADVRLAQHLDNRWTIVLERLSHVADAAEERAGDLPRVGHVGESLRWIRHNLAAAAAAESRA